MFATFFHKLKQAGAASTASCTALNYVVAHFHHVRSLGTISPSSAVGTTAEDHGLQLKQRKPIFPATAFMP
jgi:hypothetical protein